MSLRKKYSLNENLYEGRGLGLLKEEYQTIAVDGGFKSGPTGKQVYATEEEARRAYETGAASAATGKLSQASLKEVIEAMGGTVQSVAQSNEGADVVCTVNGQQVALELGLADKTTQLGYYYPGQATSARFGWEDYPRKKDSIVDRQDAMISAFGADFKPGMVLQGGDYLKYWNASGDDVLVYAASRQGPFKAVALTAAGKKAFPHLDMADASMFGTGTITGSGQGRGDESGTPGNEKRYGFKCFGARSGMNPAKMKDLVP